MKNKSIKMIAFENEKGFLSFFCQCCQKWHHHGKGEGHRTAHCTAVSLSPFKLSGYTLVNCGEMPENIKKQFKFDR